jgi:tRNA U34 5-carboxymethylaminomethyl modifying GTPase MnmE/TrmE
MNKFCIIFAAALLISSVTINAQAKKTPRERAWDLQKLLNLSDAQEGNIEYYYTEMDARIKKIINQNRGNKEKIRELTKQAIDFNEEQIEKILTVQQKEKYNKLKEEFKSKIQSKSAGSIKNSAEANKK